MSWIFAGRVLINMPTHSSFEEQIRAYNEELRRYYAQSHPASPTSPESEPEPEPAEEPPAAKPETPPQPDEKVEEEPVADETMPVERPWESAQVDEWMEQILHPKAAEDEEAVDPWASVAAFMEREGLSGFAEQTEPAPEPEAPPADAVPPTDENSDAGYLQVRVFSARGAVPLVGANVSVIGHNPAGQETLLYLNRTDISGIAPQVSLPTPDRALSLRPGDATPFLNYIVQVSAPGYATIRNEGVSVYGGITSLQGVQMIPLPEPQSEYENTVVIRPGGAPPELN